MGGEQKGRREAKPAGAAQERESVGAPAWQTLFLNLKSLKFEFKTIFATQTREQ